MGVKCFWIEATGDASVTFEDGTKAVIPWVSPHNVPEGSTREYPKLIQGKRWQGISPRYVRKDTGEIHSSIAAFGPGAMWDAWWYRFEVEPGGYFLEPVGDGLSLCVTLPNGADWFIDGRASNCTMKDDVRHHCWVRHGAPPNITVDKNGLTCRAGAGSIQQGNYHGFLRNGEFT